jgi:alkylation response protein AidB-like acyl-CoA dehydrogenase
MDLGFTADEEAFRLEVRGWLDRNLPAEWRHRGVGGFREEEETDLQRQWQRRLHEAGWLKLAWPKSAGGREATPVMQAIYQEEMEKAGAPGILGRLGVSLLAPTLLVHGSQWQKETYVEKVLSGDLNFCQGFSEPDARTDGTGIGSSTVRRPGRAARTTPTRASCLRAATPRPSRTKASRSSWSTCINPVSRCGGSGR